MIEAVINKINSDITTDIDIRNVYGLVDLVSKGELQFPAEYCGKDEYKKVDIETQFVYHRLISAVSVSSDDSPNGCSDQYGERKYTMVCVVGHKKLTDDAYADIKLAETIASKIQSLFDRETATAISVDNIERVVTGMDSDRSRVWSEEFIGQEIKTTYDRSLVKINYEINLVGSLSCGDLFCD